MAEPRQSLQQAMHLQQSGDAAGAALAYVEILRARPGDAECRFLLARLLYDHRRYTEAVEHLNRIVSAEPLHEEAAALLPRCLIRLDRLTEAAEMLERALQQQPKRAGLHFDLGRVHRKAGRAKQAMRCFERALELNPQHVAAHNNLGNLLLLQKHYEAAAVHFQRAAELDPQRAEPLCNLAQLEQARGRPERVRSLLDAALQREPNHPHAHLLLGQWLAASADPAAAERHLRAAVHASPHEPAALFALAQWLGTRGDDPQSVEWLRRTLQQKPDHAAAHLALAQLLNGLGYEDAALEHARRAVQHEPRNATARTVLGGLLEGAKLPDEALAEYRQALELNPAAGTAAFFLYAFLRRKMADWQNYDALCGEAQQRLAEFLERSDAESPPAPLTLNLFPLPAAQRAQAARRYAEMKREQAGRQRGGRPFEHRARDGGRLRIGYLSPDFREHPVGILMQDVFAAHDRDRVEVHAYSLMASTDAVFQRIREGCDHFHPVYAVPSVEVAARIAADGIHVLIDLGGHTAYTRGEIMAMRPAPVQCHFLGYPGTLGAEDVPWMLADRWIVPPEHRTHYSETIVDLPHAFVGSALPIAANAGSRADHGLPQTGFVFACFNNCYKIDPPLYDIWMRVLRQVPGSVLWLAHCAAPVQARLRMEAERRGVASERLVFAPHRPQADYLAALRHADLFLDTFGYAAGSTAVCALWAGLPVLSCMGDTNAGRMGASISAAAGLDALVCANAAVYEQRALELAAGAKDELRLLRDGLSNNRRKLPLFDVAGFARSLENAFDLMWGQRAAAGEAGRVSASSPTVTE